MLRCPYFFSGRISEATLYCSTLRLTLRELHQPFEHVGAPARCESPRRRVELRRRGLRPSGRHQGCGGVRQHHAGSVAWLGPVSTRRTMAVLLQGPSARNSRRPHAARPNSSGRHSQAETVPPRTLCTCVADDRLTSSSRSRLHTTNARRTPSFASPPARRSSSSGLPTPVSRQGLRPGSHQRARQLKSVGTPSRLRRAATFLRAGETGGETEGHPRPVETAAAHAASPAWRHRGRRAGPTAAASGNGAVAVLHDGQPVPATTRAAAVLMLKVPAPSPPVPQVSRTSSRPGSSAPCARRSTRAARRPPPPILPSSPRPSKMHQARPRRRPRRPLLPWPASSARGERSRPARRSSSVSANHDGEEPDGGCEGFIIQDVSPPCAPWPRGVPRGASPPHILRTGEEA